MFKRKTNPYLVRIGDDGGRAPYPEFNSIVYAEDRNHAAYELARHYVQYIDLLVPEWLQMVYQRHNPDSDIQPSYETLLLEHLKEAADSSRYENSINICGCNGVVGAEDTAIIVVMTPRLYAVNAKPAGVFETQGALAYACRIVEYHEVVAAALHNARGHRPDLFASAIFFLDSIVDCTSLPQIVDVVNAKFASKNVLRTSSGDMDKTHQEAAAFGIEILQRSESTYLEFQTMPSSLFIGKATSRARAVVEARGKSA